MEKNYYSFYTATFDDWSSDYGTQICLDGDELTHSEMVERAKHHQETVDKMSGFWVVNETTGETVNSSVYSKII